MPSTGLHIARGLHLPDDYVTKTAAIVAKRRVGKTYTGAVLAEELVDRGLPFYALDPTSAWWGLRAAADGKREGLPVTIVGGEHGDVPLEITAGKVVADLVVEEPGWYVIDLGLVDTHADTVRFATAFLDRIYRAKSKKRDALHGFWDEADLFAPQRPGPDETKMLGAAESIVRRGGIRGLGTTLITQRPAVLNKNVLTQVDLLVALRIIAPQDRSAVDEYLKGEADPDKRREVLDSLAGLELGEAWIYGPGEDPPIYKRLRIRERRTFNSSATPKPGEKRLEPKKLADVDLAALQSKMAETIERVKADDPKQLRHDIRRLKAELAKAQEQTPQGEPDRVEVPVLPRERIDHLEAALDDMRRVQEKFTSALERALDQARGPFDDGIAAIQEKAEQIRRDLARVSQTPAAALRGAAPRAPAGQGGPTRPARVARPAPAPATNGDGPAVSTSQQRILDALAMLEAIGIPAADKTQLALFARTKPTSGGYKNNLGALRNQHAYIHYPTPGTVALTDDGRAHADGTAAPSSNEELHELVRGLVPAAMWAIVDQLIEVYPNPLTREDLADRVGVPVTSGGYKNNLGRLRSLGLIDYPLQGFVEALPVLFLEGAPA